MIDEARTSGAKVHFASLVDICHLKNAEFEAKHQKHKGREELRSDWNLGTDPYQIQLPNLIAVDVDGLGKVGA